MINNALKTDDAGLVILGVEFPNVEIYNAAKGAIGSSIIEGYTPTKDSVERIKDIFLQKYKL
jgi:hypothetical protein